MKTVRKIQVSFEGCNFRKDELEISVLVGRVWIKKILWQTKAMSLIPSFWSEILWQTEAMSSMPD